MYKFFELMNHPINVLDTETECIKANKLKKSSMFLEKELLACAYSIFSNQQNTDASLRLSACKFLKICRFIGQTETTLI